MEQQRVIFHIDVNSAFLSWESVYRIKVLGEELDLRTIPAAIGGDEKQRRGIILAKSIPAKKFGVRTGESIMEARRKCPQLYLVPSNYELYKKNSRAFMAILQEYSPDVEQYSIDEAFIDMTGMQALFGEPVKAAYTIKDRIRDELGFTVNVGISRNKYLAKMASDFEKPDKVHTLFPEEIQEKMWPLPVGDLLFVGKSTVKKLETMGIHTIGELAKTDREILKKTLKKQGESIWNFANGIDFSLVQTEPEMNKGYGNSTTISFDVTDAEAARTVLLALSESVGARLRKDQVKIQVVSVTIKDNQLKKMSHQKILPSATDITNEIYQAACELFEELWDGRPIRLLGVQTSHTKEEEARQLSLFDDGSYEKWEQMDQAVDAIRKKYGRDAVKRASFLKKDSINKGFSIRHRGD
ncbi:DNA polymerase IV [Ruminococcus sp. 5_1_39BFAA]|uniref:DNA polymerase Y family protein n=1 Tax=Ruminococcus sp. 5_1_39BFAA TaxID=457412 RepID=UPI00356AC976